MYSISNRTTLTEASAGLAHFSKEVSVCMGYLERIQQRLARLKEQRNQGADVERAILTKREVFVFGRNCYRKLQRNVQLTAKRWRNWEGSSLRHQPRWVTCPSREKSPHDS